MKKVYCFALLALSALAADTGARHDLSNPASIVSGFAVVWTSSGQVGLRVKIDGLESFTYDISLRAQPEGGFAGGNASVGSFVTNDRGMGVGGGFVAVDPAWDDNGDGVIRVMISVFPRFGRAGGEFFVLRTEILTLQLR